MLPLVWRASEDKSVLLPDACPGEIESRLTERLPEIESLGVGVEDIDGGVILHVLINKTESREKDEIELIVLHVIVPYFPGGSLIGDIVWRIRYHEIRLSTRHETLIGERVGAVAADEPVPSERPDVTGMCHLRF